MVKNAYIHIPFCTRRCNYCSFVSYDTLTLKNIYIDALSYEIKSFYNKEVLSTLYFGGGTPSTLSVSDFKQILSLLNYDEKTELTVEINPESVDKDYLLGLKDLGVNRLSIGTQIFDNNILKVIGRHHTKEDAIRTIKTAQNVGFDNISVDLIYGLPKQNMKNLKESLSQTIDLNIQHVSLYGLKIEEGCHFYNNKPDFLPENDDQAQMYIDSVEFLVEAGFNHYEISNFAKENFESKHNLNYWDNGLYYGFGVSASGYQDKTRCTNQNSIEKYIQNPKIKSIVEEIKDENMLEEEIFLGFRRTEGIDTAYINSKYNINFNEKYKDIIDKYLESKHLKKTAYGYALTLEGILLSNNILSEFIEFVEA